MSTLTAFHGDPKVKAKSNMYSKMADKLIELLKEASITERSKVKQR